MVFDCWLFHCLLCFSFSCSCLKSPMSLNHLLYFPYKEIKAQRNWVSCLWSEKLWAEQLGLNSGHLTPELDCCVQPQADTTHMHTHMHRHVYSGWNACSSTLLYFWTSLNTMTLNAPGRPGNLDPPQHHFLRALLWTIHPLAESHHGGPWISWVPF